MARTTSVWTLGAISTSVLAHMPSESDYTDTSVPKAPHPYWWQGPYSSSLVETQYIAPTAVPLPTLSPSEQEPCETTSSPTVPPRPSSERSKVLIETATFYQSAPVPSDYESRSASSEPVPVVYAVTEPSSLAAYATSLVESIASTWLPPSYTEVITYVPSSAGQSTWLGPSYTEAVPLPLSSTTQGVASSASAPSEPYSTSLDSGTISIPSLSPATTMATSVGSSTAVYPTDSSTASGFSSIASSGQLSSTILVPVPPPQTSISVSSKTGGFVTVTSGASSSTFSSSVSEMSQPLPTSSLQSSSSTYVSPSITRTSFVPSSSADVGSMSSLASAIVSSSSASAFSSYTESTSADLPSSVESSQSVSRPQSSDAVVSSPTDSPTLSITSPSSELTSIASRPTAIGSSVRYTLSTLLPSSLSAPTETITGPPPAPPVQTGAANSFSVVGQERAWWISFLLPTLLLLL